MTTTYVSKMAVVSALLFFVLINGCSLRGQPLDYSVNLPASFSQIQDDKAGSPISGKWWKRFGDEHLNALMEEAFMNNLDIAQAYERFKQAQAVFKSADSAGSLQLNIAGSASRSRQVLPSGAYTASRYGLSAAASYEIDVWNKLSSRADAALLEALASQNDVRALYISISAALADLYYLSAEQSAQVELADRTIASFRDTLQSVENRYREGLVPVIDVYQSRQNVAAAEAQRTVFSKNLEIALNALYVLLGRFPSVQAEADFPELPEPPDFQVGLPSMMLFQRPDIRAALLRVKAGDARLAAAIADRFPSFNLIGSAGGSSEQIRRILDSPNLLWNILIDAAQPVLDGGRRKAEVERSEAVLKERLLTYHKVVLDAFREVEDALIRGREDRLLIDRLSERVAVAAEELRYATDNYLLGLSDYLPVLLAQRRYYESASALLDARRQLISATIELSRAIGGEWMEENMALRLSSALLNKEEKE
jgi:NodT family efflux transporter outer membrane factor (OMF) lipoprotein